MSERVALVTGASRGIGLAIAEQLAQDGLLVVMNYRENRDAAEAACARIAAAGGQAVLSQFDVADSDQVSGAIKGLAREYGLIDVLVNNAGIGADLPFLRTKKRDWDRVMAVNLDGVYHCCYAVVKSWAGTRCGSRIVNVSSVLSLRGHKQAAAYTAAKAGVNGLTIALARELAPKGVTVNAISPGYVPTDIHPDHPAYTDGVEQYVHQTPLRRPGKSEEIASLLSFLVSEAAGYITGEIIRVDGGIGI